jgi:RNA polymerase sigma factor (sigma-70 family)
MADHAHTPRHRDTARVRSQTPRPDRPPGLGPLDGLVAAARSGDSRAWEELHAGFTPVLRAVARRHRLDAVDVEDVVQSTWARCHEHLHRLRDPRALPGWLVTTCRNEALRTIRGRSRLVPVPHEALAWPAGSASNPSAAPDPLEAVLEAEQLTALRTAVAALPQRQRLLLTALLRGDGEQGYRELAASLGMPLGSIGPTRGRALDRLRRELAPLVA